MSRAVRISAAAMLVLAVAAFPVVLDRCAATCEVHREAIASAPSCHHATSAAIRIGPAPSPCGHDHHGTALRSTSNLAPSDRSNGVLAAAVPVQGYLPPAASELRGPGHAPPGASLLLDARSLPLRI